ncbi:hypothetical protein NDU88_002646 [Pleurodeles waltl]|uniref:Uncharacterized protein n=1 Tax=Pleurodeles waltl TaxID=8319 RepID=A0AAV7Q7K4_PLEWA|nr:hypothetical protein NDU88_002646 [Pleurodeles waltl]
MRLPPRSHANGQQGTSGKLLGRVDGSCRCHGFRAMERAIGGMWNAGGLAVVERGRKILKYTPKVTVLVIEGEGDGVEDEYETAIKSLDVSYRFVNFVVKGKDVLGRVDGSCRCHGFRAMERAIGGMWNAGGLAVVERGWCGRNG